MKRNSTNISGSVSKATLKGCYHGPMRKCRPQKKDVERKNKILFEDPLKAGQVYFV